MVVLDTVADGPWQLRLEWPTVSAALVGRPFDVATLVAGLVRAASLRSALID